MFNIYKSAVFRLSLLFAVFSVFPVDTARRQTKAGVGWGRTTSTSTHRVLQVGMLTLGMSRPFPVGMGKLVEVAMAIVMAAAMVSSNFGDLIGCKFHCLAWL